MSGLPQISAYSKNASPVDARGRGWELDTEADIEFMEFANKHPEESVNVEVWESPELTREWDVETRRTRDSNVVEVMVVSAQTTLSRA